MSGFAKFMNQAVLERFSRIRQILGRARIELQACWGRILKWIPAA